MLYNYRAIFLSTLHVGNFSFMTILYHIWLILLKVDIRELNLISCKIYINIYIYTYIYIYVIFELFCVHPQPVNVFDPGEMILGDLFHVKHIESMWKYDK